MAVSSINGKSIKDLCGWRPDEERIADFNMLNPRLMMQAPHLMATERRDVHLWNALMAVMPSWRRGAQEIGDCFAEGTLVPGPDNTKRIEDVKIGDRVYAGDGTITRVVSRVKKETAQPMVTLHACGGLPLTVTVDHKVLAYRFPYADNDSHKKRISKGLYERQFKNAKGQPGGHGRKNTVVELFENRVAELVPAGELRESDYLLAPIEFETEEMPAHPMLLTEEGQWVYGYFLGNGSHNQSAMSFSGPMKKLWVAERIVAFFGSLGIDADIKEYINGKRAWGVYVKCGGQLAESVIEMAYGEDGEKLLPSWGYRSESLVDGLLEADGHTGEDGDVQHFDSTSLSLISGVLWHFHLRGLDATVAEVIPSKTGRFANAKRLYRVSVRHNKQRQRIWRDDQYLARPIRKIEFSEGPHEVYDIGVSHPDHTFLGQLYTTANCVSWGSELVCTTLMCLQHVKGTGKFIAEAATEAIYGGCRVEALGKNRGGRSDGAFGAAAAKWVRDWGVILRTDMGRLTGIDEHDLREYSGRKAKDWGDYGCGGQQDGGKLDTAAKEMPVQHVVGVSTVEEAAAAIQNMYPITIASMAGFGDMRRDSNGICRRRGQWAHQMCVLGIRWRAGQPEFRVFQSWGPRSCSGPDPGIHHPAISGCSWWITPEDMAWILRTGDCWIHGDIHGLPPQNLDIVRPASYWFQTNSSDRPITYQLAV